MEKKAQKINQNAALVIHPNHSIDDKRNIFLNLLAAIAIYSCFFPIAFLDFSMILYQSIYFRIVRIPLLPRKEYVVIERWRLPKLTIWQRFNCIYCDYANGVMAWAKDIIGWTEIHSCAIKNSTTLVGQQHVQGYYERELFK